MRNKNVDIFTPLPRDLEFIDGAHMVVAGSTKGGPGKSSTIITAAGVCSHLDLQYIVASYDQSNTTLERCLGAGSVTILDAQTPELARSTLAAVMTVAKKNRAIVLLDLPGAMNTKESALLENIQKARLIEDFESLYMVCPVSPDAEELEGACAAIKIFQPDQVLIRARRPSKYCSDFPDFVKPWTYLKEFPIWECEQWSKTIKDIYDHTGRFSHLPPVPKLKSYLTANFGKLSMGEEKDIEDVLLHVDAAARPIYEHLFANITTKKPKS